MTIEGVDRERLKELFLELLREDREFRRGCTGGLEAPRVHPPLHREAAEVLHVPRVQQPDIVDPQ